METLTTRELRDLVGSVFPRGEGDRHLMIMVDALLTQREIARHLVEDRHADYVFTVKDNQPTLRGDIADFLEFERCEAERLQQAHNPHSRDDAFPPSAPNRGQGPRSRGGSGDMDEYRSE